MIVLDNPMALPLGFRKRLRRRDHTSCRDENKGTTCGGEYADQYKTQNWGQGFCCTFPGLGYFLRGAKIAGSFGQWVEVGLTSSRSRVGALHNQGISKKPYVRDLLCRDLRWSVVTSKSHICNVIAMGLLKCSERHKEIAS